MFIMNMKRAHTSHAHRVGDTHILTLQLPHIDYHTPRMKYTVILLSLIVFSSHPCILQLLLTTSAKFPQNY